jgi:RHS repeat-associated protein
VIKSIYIGDGMFITDFSEPVKLESVTNGLKIKHEGVVIDGNFESGANGKEIRFIPSTPFQPGQMSVEIEETVEDEAGNQMGSPFSNTFMYSGTPAIVHDIDPPEVENIKKDLDGFKITFSERIDETTTTSSIEIKKADGTISGSITTIDERTFKFTPDEMLAANQEYTLWVYSTLKDLSGKSINEFFHKFMVLPDDFLVYEKPDPNKHVYSRIGNNYLFHGREYEPEVGLYNYRNRYYMPRIGRFLQTDPTGYLDSMNLYQAFNQNPVNFTDPFGRSQVYPGVPGTSYGEMELYHKDPEFKRFVDGYYRGMGNTIFNPLTLTTVGLTIINPAAGIAFGLGALTNTYYHSVKGRLEEGQSFGGSLGGGVLDLTGVSDIQASIKVKDPYKSGELVGSGSVKVGATVLAAVYAAKMGLNKLRSVSEAPQGGSTIKYNAKAGRFYDANTGKFIKFIDVPWPEPNGFVSYTENMAEIGQIVDRYGPETGRFLAPEGTPYSHRGIPEGYTEYHKYEVINPFPWKEGYSKKSVEFKSEGGGYQYMTSKSIKELVAEGYLRRIE